MARRSRVPAVLLGAAVLVLTVSACSSGGGSESASRSSAHSSAPASASASASAGAPAAAAGQPFGPGCAAVPASGPGSLAAVSTVPVGAAAGTNPELTSLVHAVTAANLADSLNGQQNVTVLAPVNAAFSALPADQVNALLADVPRLTAVLTHHVLQGRLGPDKLAGQHTTLDNDTVTIEGSGEKFTIPGAQTQSGKPATVVCGNIQTANATVYLIDQILKPKAAG